MIVWTEYMKYRARLRGFALEEIERVVRFSSERYRDLATGRTVVVGNHHGALVLVPVESDDLGNTVPVTVHRTTRQQINGRLRSGRYTDE